MCTVAAIIYFIGYMPPRGTTVTVPAAQVRQMTEKQKTDAARCARRYGIKWVIGE